MAPAQLAPILRAARCDDVAQVLAGHRATRIGDREEPDVVGRGDATGGGERVAHGSEDRATAREHADRVELRRLASAGERADAAKKRAREHAARTVDPRQQGRDHRLRLPRAARELRVGREGGGVETLVVRDRAEQMRRILRPPGETKVDLGDRAVPVALQERLELALQEGRQVAAAEGRAEVGGLAVGERRPRRRVFAGTRREGPEIEIHLCRRVERQTAQQRPELVVARNAAEQPPGEVVGEETGADQRDEPGEHPRRPRQEQALERIKPLLRRVERAGVETHGLVHVTQQAFARRVGPQQRAHQHRRRPGVRHGTQTRQERSQPRSAARSEARVFQQPRKDPRAPRLHHRHDADRDLARRGVSYETGEIAPEAHAGLHYDRHASGGIPDMPPDGGGERRAQEPEGLRAHGREGLQNALRDVDRQVDAQIAIGIGRAGRDRIERGDIPRLDDPELALVDRPFDVLRPSAEMRFDPPS